MALIVDIIVLNWNGAEDTLRCVASLRCQTFPYRRILLVDNGSSDNSLQTLAPLEALDRIQLLKLPDNLGFVGGNNLAMAKAFADGADYVWLFNNDATADPDTLARIVAVGEADPAIGLISPIVLEADDPGQIQFGCGLFDLSPPGYQPTTDREQARLWQSAFPNRIVLYGTALLVRRQLFEAAGGFHDPFFAYWEDIDFSIRSAAAGFRNVSVLDAAIYHPSKDTRGDPDEIRPHYYYFYTRNEILLWRKHSKKLVYLRILMWIFVRQLKQIVRMPGHRAGIDAVLAGFWHGLRGQGGPFDASRQMPNPLRYLLARYPQFWLRVLGVSGR